MSTLSGNTIASSYPSLLRYDNFTGNTSSTDLIGIVDGLGNRTPLSLAGTKMSVRDNVDFTLATEVNFDGTKLKIAGSDMDFTTTNTTGITKNFAVKDAGGRQQPIDGLINFSASTGINITEDVGTGTFTFSTTSTDSNIIKVGTGITTTDGKAVWWDRTEWSTSPTSSNAYNQLIGISNGTNTLTDGVIISGLVTKAAQTGYTAGDLYLPDTPGGFETDKSNIFSPNYIRGIGHSLGSVGIVLNPDIFYSASTNVPPTPSPTVTPSITPTITPSITPSVTVTPTPSVTITPTPSSSVPSGDPDATAYLADIVASGGTTTPTIDAAVQTLFTSLKSAGLYTKIKAMYPILGGVAGSHAINAIGNKTFDITFAGGWTHNSSGMSSNGVNTEGDTHVIPATDLSATNNHTSTFFKPISTQASAYDGAGPSPYLITTSSRSLEAFNGSAIMSSLGTITSKAFIISVKENNTSAFAATNPDGAGYSVKRTSATAATTVPSNSWTFGHINTIGFWTTALYEFGTLGDGMTQAEASTLNGIIETFLTSIGRN